MEQTKQKYEPLPEIQTHFHGVGIPDLTAQLIERTQTKAWYKRSDEVWEVFRITIIEDAELFGKFIPAHEHYPANEDFGKIAWCFSNRVNAERCYRRLI